MTTVQSSREFHLDRRTHDAIIEHARSDFPYEVCGLLAGHDGRLTAHYRIPNAARSMTFYNMDPTAMLAAMNEMDDHDWDLIGIYHSHTHTEAYPSSTDVDLAFYADAAYLIVENGRGAFVDTGTNHSVPRLLEAARAARVEVEQP